MEIAVISGKGGTGKSSVTAAFATIAGNLVLADCDVDAANLYLLFNPEIAEESVYIAGHKARINYDVCTHCGICFEHCAFDAIGKTNGYVSISEISCDGCFLCSRVCPEHAISMIPNDKSRMYSGTFRNGRMAGWRPGRKIRGSWCRRSVTGLHGWLKEPGWIPSFSTVLPESVARSAQPSPGSIPWWLSPSQPCRVSVT